MGFTARIPALRAALRLARRDAWRNKGRSALIALMVALPVLAASTVSVVYRSDARDPQDVVAVTLGSQAQASLSIGNGQPTEQSVDGQGGGSVGDGAGSDSTRPKPLSGAQFRAKAQTLVSPRDHIVADNLLTSNRVIRFHDRSLSAAVREIDYSASGVRGLVKQVSGRSPAQAGEVVVSQNLAKKKGIRDGDQLAITPSRNAEPKTVTVVGIVGGTALIGNPSVIGPVGSLIPAELLDPNSTVPGGYASQNLLVLGPDPVTWDQVLDLNQLGSMVVSRSVIEHPPSADRVPYSAGDYGSAVPAGALGIGAVVLGLVLLQIALLAGPAIAVGARRNQRSLAIMASAGAERRQLRTVVLASSGVIGLVSCLVAALLGGGLGSIVVLVLRDRFDQPIPRVDLRPLDLIGLALVGGLTAVAAALIPARQAARLDVVAALTGRRGQSPPRLRVPVAGLAVAVVGVSLALYASQSRRPFYTAAGLALTEIGLVAAAGAIVALAARLAVRLPFAPRFALRDAARQRGRTAPAVAAVLAAIAGGTAALMYISAQARHDEQTYTPSAALGVVTVEAGQGSDASDLAAAEAATRRTLPIDRTAVFYGLPNPGDGSGTFLSTAAPPQNQCPADTDANQLSPAQAEAALRSDPRCAATSGGGGPGTVGFQGNSLFDDGSALDLLTGTSVPADTAALRAGRVLVSDPEMLWPDGTVHVVVARESVTDDSASNEKTVTLPARLSTRTPRLSIPVFPRAAAKPLGVDPQPAGLFASTTRMPTTTEEDAARAATEDANGYLSLERGYQDHYAIGLLALVVAAGFVTLAGTFTAVGLAAAEGRADIATLAAVGASPGVRRRLAASQAGVIAGLGAILGVGSGVLAGWILVRMQQHSTERMSSSYGPTLPGDAWHVVVPWTYLLATGFGVPLLAVLIGFLSTRSRLPLVRRLGQ